MLQYKLQNIVPGEGSQLQMIAFCMISLICNTQQKQIILQKESVVGWGVIRADYKQTERNFRAVMKMDCGDG